MHSITYLGLEKVSQLGMHCKRIKCCNSMS
jgi:hypothetical protein